MVTLKKILNIGISDSLSLVEYHKQRAFNLFILLALPALPIALAFNIYRNNVGMIYINSLQILIFLFACWISITRKFLFLRTYLLVFLSIIIFFAALQFNTGIQFRLLFLLVVGVILFDNNYRFLFFTFLIAFEFAFCKYQTLRLQHAEGIYLILPIVQVYIPLVITGISLFYLKYIYLQTQHKLQKTLDDVTKVSAHQEKLMYSLAHDLRSPLNNVTSLVRILKQHKGYSEDEMKWLNIIEQSTSNSNALINELLESNELVKPQLELKVQDIIPIIENAVQTSNLNSASKNISIHFTQHPSTCELQIDKLKIDRLLSNLLHNAIKFSYPNGKIYISLEITKAVATIFIKDEGVGVPSDQTKTIFEAFTKDKKPGTQNETSFGLGLSICQQIVDLHFGKIWVESELGKGSTFVIQLPKGKK